jgi:hypothetical protein
VDAHGCSADLLRSPAALGALFDRIVRELDLHAAAEPVFRSFPGEGGVTGFLLLTESHLTCHTFPERASPGSTSTAADHVPTGPGPNAWPRRSGPPASASPCIRGASDERLRSAVSRLRRYGRLHAGRDAAQGLRALRGGGGAQGRQCRGLWPSGRADSHAFCPGPRRDRRLPGRAALHPGRPPAARLWRGDLGRVAHGIRGRELGLALRSAGALPLHGPGPRAPFARLRAHPRRSDSRPRALGHLRGDRGARGSIHDRGRRAAFRRGARQLAALCRSFRPGRSARDPRLRHRLRGRSAVRGPRGHPRRDRHEGVARRGGSTQEGECAEPLLPAVRRAARDPRPRPGEADRLPLLRLPARRDEGPRGARGPLERRREAADSAGLEGPAARHGMDGHRLSRAQRHLRERALPVAGVPALRAATRLPVAGRVEGALVLRRAHLGRRREAVWDRSRDLRRQALPPFPGRPGQGGRGHRRVLLGRGPR